MYSEGPVWLYLRYTILHELLSLFACINILFACYHYAEYCAILSLLNIASNYLGCTMHCVDSLETQPFQYHVSRSLGIDKQDQDAYEEVRRRKI